MIERKSISKVKFRCPVCGHFIFGEHNKDNSTGAKCPNCKAIIYCKEHGEKERLIKVKFN